MKGHTSIDRSDRDSYDLTYLDKYGDYRGPNLLREDDFATILSRKLLNGKKGVSEKLRARILQAARELNYANLGSGLYESESKHILVLAPEYVINDRVFYPEYLWEIERVAKARGCNAIIQSGRLGHLHIAVTSLHFTGRLLRESLVLRP